MSVQYPGTLGFFARISVDFKGYFWQDFDRDFDSISKGILNILREIARNFSYFVRFLVILSGRFLHFRDFKIFVRISRFFLILHFVVKYHCKLHLYYSDLPIW